MKHGLSLVFACLAFHFFLPARAQGQDELVALNIESSTKGVLFPSMTTVQRTTLGALNPTEGLLVFDTDVEAYFYFMNGDWAQLSTSTGNDVPVGTIMMFGGSIAPEGYLPCDGSSVSSIAHPALFAAIGTSWGGNGIPNFNLPDLRGRFPRGWDNGAGNDPDAGARTALYNGGQTGNNVGSYQNDELKSHSHTQKYSVVSNKSMFGIWCLRQKRAIFSSIFWFLKEHSGAT